MVRLVNVLVLVLLSAIAHGQSSYCLPDRFGANDTLFEKSDLVLDFDREYGQATNWLGETDTLRLDVYAPRNELDTLAQRPLIIYLHGGGFRAGSKSTQKGRYWAESFARRGYVFAAVDYRLGWPFADSCSADTAQYMRALWRAVQDTRAAWRWLADEAPNYRIDTGAVFFLGTSAGSAAGLLAVYARETDFGPYLFNELGALDAGGNTLPRRAFRPKGMITKSGGTEGLYALERYDAPHLLFHGTCDLTVPYQDGPLFYCYAPNRFVNSFGSASIAEALREAGRCHTLYSNIGQGHGAVDDDTVVVYGATFAKGILCETCPLPERLDRQSKLNVCSDRSGIVTQVEWVYPNPTQGLVQVILSGPRDDRLRIELVDRIGRIVRSEERDFTAPVASWTLDYRGISPGMYLLKAGVFNRFSSHRILLVP